MALLQFISAGLPEAQLPVTIHGDHMIMAEKGAGPDLENAKREHREVYAFLASACAKYNMGFWRPGSGIIHTILLENYAFPGGLMIGTDSHTPNAGGLGMLGIGVGGSDAVDAMAGMPWELQCPKVMGVRLTGKLQGWASSKDIILKLAGIVSVSGGKGKIVEFFGPGTETLGATAMATICNMSAEIGSTSCIFPYSDAMARYLSATKRDFVADAAKNNMGLLRPDEGSDKYYDEVIEIDLDTLEPHINGPYTPDLSHPLSKFPTEVEGSEWPKELSHAMVGSCTNSSWEDLKKASELIRQAESAGLKPKVPFFVTAGSEQVRATVERDGILSAFQEAGAVLLSNSCGPCVGQWNRTEVKKGVANSVISSFNRNFVGRHDGNPGTHSFVTSPELVTAFAYSGSLQFNPVTDEVLDSKGQAFKFTPPVVDELPASFESGQNYYQGPAEDREALTVEVDPKSDRLQLLQPFEPWKAGNAEDLTILIKVKGKCTTDHISPAGPWYNYRGHLENISNNLLIGAENAFLPGASNRGHTQDLTTSPTPAILPVPEVAKSYKRSNIRWVIIGENNYGEGSSREHAALEPRYLGGVAVVANSFARIHETNLKKQGMLPLTFADPAAYDRIQADDRVDILGVEDIRPGEQLTMRVRRKDGEVWETKLNHTFHEGQIRWLMSGSALNYIKSQKSKTGF
ncbi:putative aconitate hydratase [Lasiodiplodia theobromae]|uniref:Aconitate hydratase, mitochondrial n=1 Tax=Lasiodiplodia theobromae TaxID=45133 RepID=A0A5N5DGQ1_9PEZI|nr:putative aconitate hydratase [Lasiodiplodia theobromae]